MPSRLSILFAAVGVLGAQQVAAPTPEQVGPARGENQGNYNITQSFEIGYRWSLVSGAVVVMGLGAFGLVVG